MGWSMPVWWWVAAGLLAAAELVTGTFYLLMLAVGAAVGALTAHAGAGFALQMAAAAVAGGAAAAALRRRRRRQPPRAAAAWNADVILDIGSRVRVEHWRSDATARVDYRGAGWDARYRGPGRPAPGEFRIVSIEGIELLLDD